MKKELHCLNQNGKVHSFQLHESYAILFNTSTIQPIPYYLVTALLLFAPHNNLLEIRAKAHQTEQNFYTEYREKCERSGRFKFG